MKCTKCNYEAEQEFDFCPNCGESTNLPIKTATKNRTAQIFCPKCGSQNLQTIVKTDVTTTGKNFSATQGCCGALLLGPLGVLCGSCGQSQKTTSSNTTLFACNDCGHEFEKKEDLLKKIESYKKSIKLGIPVLSILGIFYFIFMIFLIEGDKEFILPIFFSDLIIFGLSDIIVYFINKHYINKTEAKLYEYEKKQKEFAQKNS